MTSSLDYSLNLYYATLVVTRVVGPRHRQDPSMHGIPREFGQRTNIVGIVVIDAHQVVALPQQSVLRRVRDTIGTIIFMNVHDP